MIWTLALWAALTAIALPLLHRDLRSADARRRFRMARQVWVRLALDTEPFERAMRELAREVAKTMPAMRHMVTQLQGLAQRRSDGLPRIEGEA